ncbi:MAG: hypothetical protein H3C31_05660 [Brumimicrobium sp.]|nr:hypothetical protein [Brumimicrobium sp.]MCO5268254.1 hypothetical protein [Brumimicrobium sp.]
MEEVQQVISQIQLKISKMQDSMSQVKTENEALKSEVQLLNDKLVQRVKEAEDFQEKYNELVRQQVSKPVGDSIFPIDRDAEIDALVREIDDCISRLKA